MRRKSSTDDSSLELLLDTICNTFGGILFISMLVVTLLNLTAKEVQETPPTQPSQLELIEAEIEREQVTSQLEKLRRAVQAESTIRDSIVSPEALALAKRLKEKQLNQTRKIEDKSNLVGQVSNSQIEVNRIKQTAKNRQAELKAAQQKHDQLKKQLEQTVQSRSNKATFAKVEQTALNSATFFLVDGKLYGPRILPGGGLNKADFLHKQSNGVTVVEPNPSGGVVVDPTANNIGPVVSKLSSIRSSQFFVKMFVWSNSFTHCESVQKAMKQLGLETELIPLADGTVIRLGGSSSGPSYTQRN